MILEIYDHYYRGAFILWINVRNTLIKNLVEYHHINTSLSSLPSPLPSSSSFHDDVGIRSTHKYAYYDRATREYSIGIIVLLYSVSGAPEYSCCRYVA